ncbi:DUF4913 domain-containing protein [Nocardia sp. NPDC058518]|uniref:DUF4913 domain-containing protein n=1 Tax=Nocardia sp. NPDC058518 TaxID=3346534 RepID=UPI00364FD632
MSADPAELVAALVSEIAKLTAANAAPKEKKKPQPPVCESVFEWVADYLANVYWRPTAPSMQQRDNHWCSAWFEHPEAQGRLNLLWKFWEAAQGNDEAMLRWWKEADHHMSKLMSSTGPFSLCTKKHADPERLKVDATPAKFLQGDDPPDDDDPPDED